MRITLEGLYVLCSVIRRGGLRAIEQVTRSIFENRTAGEQRAQPSRRCGGGGDGLLSNIFFPDKRGGGGTNAEVVWY